MMSEWQKVSSGFQDVSQYSDRSQQCSRLDSSTDFKFFYFSKPLEKVLSTSTTIGITPILQGP